MLNPLHAAGPGGIARGVSAEPPAVPAEAPPAASAPRDVVSRAPAVTLPERELHAMKSDMKRYIGNLSEALGAVHRSSPAANGDTARKMEIALHAMESFCAQFDPTNSLATKRKIRAEFWNFFEALKDLKTAAPEAAATLAGKLTGIDNLTTDVSPEKDQRLALLRRMRPIPSQTFATPVPKSELPNLERFEETLYRGGQPTAEGFEWLGRQGVKIDITLRAEAKEDVELPPWQNVTRYCIATTDMKAPTFEQVEQFIKILDDAGDTPAFVHCKAGVGRTGTFVACRRIAEGWPVEDALAEADAFVHSGEITKEQRDFIRSFAEHWKTTRSPS